MHAPTLHERATIYLLLADVLGRLSKLPDAPEAKKVGKGGEGRVRRVILREWYWWMGVHWLVVRSVCGSMNTMKCFALPSFPPEQYPFPPPPSQYISDALREFEGTSEEVRVTVADSELAIARGDVEGALKKLRKVPAESPHYTKVCAGGEGMRQGR